MKNLEELKKKYEELGKEIERLENQKKNKRWKASKTQFYYFVDNSTTYIDYCVDDGDYADDFRYKTRNYFKTKEEAQRHLDNINTYYDLMDLAEELNNGEKIDWNNYNQRKYHLFYSCTNKSINSDYAYEYKDLGQIFCLDENFLEMALERIGKQKLENLFIKD